MSINNNDNIEFTYPFDGQSTDGWRMAGHGKFVLQSDRSLQSQGGMGLLWYTKKKYKDFVLKVDWKVSRRNDNSGVFIRFSNPGNDPLIAVNKDTRFKLMTWQCQMVILFTKQVQYTTLQLLQM
jgi:3-keto-disaccharide hydrolase